MAKVCPKCGTSTDQDNSLFCKKCGTQLPSPASELKTGSGRNIKASLNTQLPRSSNELKTSPLCPACGADLNQNSPYCPKCLVIVNPQLVDKTIAPLTSGNPLLCSTPDDPIIEDPIDLNNSGTSGNPLLCSTCGAAIKQNSAYCPKCKTIYPLNHNGINEVAAAEKAAKLQRDLAKEHIVKLQDSGNIQLIRNFINRYTNFDTRGTNFSNLNTLLANKGIILTDLELLAVIAEVKQEGELEWVKKRILYNNPTSSDGCIKNYIEVFGKVCNDIQRERKNIPRERLINYRIKILKDNFNYQGNLASDLIRIEKEVELERFENSLTGDQASGKWITINDIDSISGYDFERILKSLFQKMGYQVIHTTLSNDQGADLIVEKFGVKTVVQAKNWQNNVTNSGIQEAVAAIKHYDAQRAMVISSSGFTQSARELAQSNNVVLWDRSILSSMLDENPIFRV